MIADEPLTKTRYKQSSGQDAYAFERRMARQLDPKHKEASADYVIWNNGSFQELEEQVKPIYSQLIK